PRPAPYSTVVSGPLSPPHSPPIRRWQSLETDADNSRQLAAATTAALRPGAGAPTRQSLASARSPRPARHAVPATGESAACHPRRGSPHASGSTQSPRASSGAGSWAPPPRAGAGAGSDGARGAPALDVSAGYTAPRCWSNRGTLAL